MTRATITIDESIVIDRPAPAVWEAVADYDFDLAWRRGLVEMAPSPPGPAAANSSSRQRGSRTARLAVS